METELRYIGEKIVSNHETLAEAVDTIVKEKQSENVTSAEKKKVRENFICLIGEALYEKKEIVLPKMLKWAESATNCNIKHTSSMSHLIRELGYCRTVIWDVFTYELEKGKFSALAMIEVSVILDPYIDQITERISEIYEKHNLNLMSLAYTSLEEVSVPVVPIVDGIAIIPIIGEIDTRRTKLIMEKTLTKASELSLSHIILDISGVIIIDEMVADKLFKIMTSLKMIGVQPVITGIRPEIAKTMVNLGIDFKSIKTCATLKQALLDLGVRKL